MGMYEGVTAYAIKITDEAACTFEVSLGTRYPSRVNRELQAHNEMSLANIPQSR